MEAELPPHLMRHEVAVRLDCPPADFIVHPEEIAHPGGLAVPVSTLQKVDAHDLGRILQAARALRHSMDAGQIGVMAMCFPDRQRIGTSLGRSPISSS